MQKDAVIGFVVGLLIGIFAIPVLQTNNLWGKLPYPYPLLLLALPAASAVGVWLARLMGGRLPFIWQVAKFGLIGVLNTAVDFGVYNILIFLTDYSRGSRVAALSVISFAVALMNSYFWNRRWVFAGAVEKKTQFIEFIVISLVAASVSYGIVAGMTAYVPPFDGLSDKQWANVAKALAVVFSFAWNFVGYKYLVFRKSSV